MSRMRRGHQTRHEILSGMRAVPALTRQGAEENLEHAVFLREPARAEQAGSGREHLQQKSMRREKEAGHRQEDQNNGQY